MGGRWYKGRVSASIHTLPVTLGDLTLVERLGAGGMAEVFLATRPSPLGGVEKVVVKRMLPHLASQDGYRRLFRREAAIGARIVDRHVVRTDSLVEDDDGLMLVVEFIDGATLRTLARAAYDRQSTLPLPVVLRLFVHAAAGLAAIHATTDEQGRPFVHRDISPDNLMVGRDGVTRVLDFGVARPGGEGVLTRTGEIRGKLPYMPPEQLDARSLDGRADLYALGVSLFWMLTGRRPFVHRSEVQLIRAIMQQRPPRVRSLAPDVPPDLDGLIDELLAKDPARRPRDALGVARRLENMGAADEADVAAFVEEFLALEPVTTRARRLQSQASTSVGRRDAASARGSLDGSPGADALGARVSTRAPTLSAASEWGGDDGHEGGHDDGPGDGPEDVHDDGDPAPPPPAPITATSATRAPRAPNADTPRRAALVGLVAGALVALGLGAVGLAVSLAPATDSGALVPRLPAAPTPAAPSPTP
ncbi:MAG: serine/threonine protein kinase, partial [Deltaproteobacteria bacterium]|nr:serine/threonine protein kinase [Deltaproteobacteria bacterium]